MAGRIVVIGAGPAGLGAAWELRRRKHANYVVLEAKGVPGGLSASRQAQDGRWWDFGGHVAYTRDASFRELLNDLFVGHELLPHPQRRGALFDGSVVPYPVQQNLTAFPAEDQKLFHEDAHRLPHPARTDNFLVWMLDTFGPHFCARFMLPYNRKLWRVPLEELSAGWCKQVVPEAGGAFKAPPRLYPRDGGIGEIWRRLAGRVGGQIVYGARVERVDLGKKRVHLAGGGYETYSALISTMPLTTLLPETGACLKAVPVVVERRGTAYHAAGSSYERLYFPNPGTRAYRWAMSHPQIRDAGTTEYAVPAATWVEDPDLWAEEFAYPVPTLGRDACLARSHKRLRGVGVRSVGRFGGWVFENGHMDQCYLAGVNAVKELLGGPS